MDPSRTPVHLPADEPLRLLVLIDVEEEFDWAGPFDRRNTRVAHLDELVRFLPVLEEAGVVPVAVCSYPVVEDARTGAVLAGLAREGRVLVGTHLHPWVCPPHDEPLGRANSFPGNLPPELEAAKLTRLGERIEEVTGTRPRVYQAGRYGLGPHSAALLERLGYLVDMSVAPPFDYSREGGPDFSHHGNAPFWFGRQRALLGLPVTGAFVGFAGGAARGLFRLASAPALAWMRLPGLLARVGAVERLRLSPEGHALADLQRLVRTLVARGLRTFTFSFHSPSLRPGCTAYVRTEDERAAFVERCRAFLAWFRGELGGRPASPLELHAEWLRRAPPVPPGVAELP